jgi:hypothetical protein
MTDIASSSSERPQSSERMGAPTAEAAVAPSSADRLGRAATTAGAVVADWRTSLPEDVRPLAQAKGWKSPGDALKSYAHLERMIGADKVALPPKDAQGNRDWSKWDGWATIGRPEAPEKYAFRAPDGHTASETDRAFQAHMAPLLHKAGLAQWQVDLLAQGLDSFGTQHRDRLSSHGQQAYAASVHELKRDWGASFDRNLDLANRAVRQFGGPDLVRALSAAGLGHHPAVVRAFARVGATLAEDSGLPGGSASGGTGSARSEIQRLKADPQFQAAFLNRLHPGHEQAMGKMLKLQAQASSGGDA